MGFAEYFDRIFVINLPSRPDRRKEMTVQLARVGLAFDHPRVELYCAIRPNHAAGFPSLGARGCFLSHLGILKNAQSNGHQRILIFEDDLDFEPHFSCRVRPLLDALRGRPWSFFYGGYETDCPLSVDSTGLASVPHGQAIRMTHFLGVQTSQFGHIARFLEGLLSRPAGDANGGPMHVDGAYNWYRRANPDRITYVAVPQLGRQRSSRTDVHDLRWFDRTPLIRESLAGLRRAKNRLFR